MSATSEALVLVLLLLVVSLSNTCFALITPPLSWEVATAVSTLEGLRATATSSTTGNKEKKLDLLTDLYDAETGLVSEGVWHNCMVGVACVKCSQQLRRASETAADGKERSALEAYASSYEEWGLRIGSSLYDLNWAGPGLGFRRRTPGKLRWEDARADAAARERIIDDGENVAFYTEGCQERRAVSNAAAVLLYGFLAEMRPNDEALAARSADIGEVFLRQFFDSSSCRFRQRSVGDEEVGIETETWRAVDQAMGVLAALRLTRAQLAAGEKRRAVRTRTMAAAAAEQLLTSVSPVASFPDGSGSGSSGSSGSGSGSSGVVGLGGFGYGPYASEGRPPPVNRLPLSPTGSSRRQRRDSWADAICCFALLAADACSGSENPNLLLRATGRDYQTTALGSAEAAMLLTNGGDCSAGGESGSGSGLGSCRQLLAHVPIEARSPDDDSGAANKCYSSTQGWWSAVQRAAGRNGAAHREDTLKPFYRALAVAPPGVVNGAGGGGAGEDGAVVALGTPLLLPVSTQDPQVRLWANTEFAASLVLDYEDFCL